LQKWALVEGPGMVTFDPPELKQKIIEARAKLNEDLGAYLFEDTYPVWEEDFDPTEYNEAVLTEESRLEVVLPNCQDEYDFSVGDLLRLADELVSCEFVEDRAVCSKNHAFVLVDVADFDSELVLRRTPTYHSRGVGGARMIGLEAVFKDSDGECRCGLVRGFTMFGLKMVQLLNYEDWRPPVDADDLFIEIRHSGTRSPEFLFSVARAYIFELNASLRIALKEIIWSTEIEDWQGLLESEEAEVEGIEFRLRPLNAGAGIDELIRLYNVAISSENTDVEILNLVKVVEYVSQAVLRRGLNESVRLKLSDPRALQPSSEYIQELGRVFEEKSMKRKDKEAIKETVRACCDAVALVGFAPKCLKKLKAIDVNSSRQKRLEALDEFADCIYSTRSSIAHAKANYRPTGRECPQEQLHRFSVCVKQAAAQVVRWYTLLPESERLS
jgi:hypothetical protein